MQKRFSYFIVMGLLLLCTFSSIAQQKEIHPGKKPAKAEKGLIPVYKSSLGNVLSNTLPTSMMKNLLDSSLIARDKNGKSYPVVAFDFGYQQKETIVNDTTGRPEATQVYHYWHFQSDGLDSIWRSRVKSELRPGDELYFEHIIAKDKKGVQYLSSPLHFKVK